MIENLFWQENDRCIRMNMLHLLTRNITSKFFTSPGSILIRNARNWRTVGSCTRIMGFRILQDWWKNYLKNTNFQLSPHLLYLLDLILCNFWLVLTIEKHLCVCRFASNSEIINEVHIFFNIFPQAKFEKTIKVKWAERMELCIVNEGRYFEKAWSKKTDCESEVNDE